MVTQDLSISGSEVARQLNIDRLAVSNKKTGSRMKNRFTFQRLEKQENVHHRGAKSAE